MTELSFDRARAVADAVLLEGYLLYPYRASSRKNRYRWTFGVLAPRRWSDAGGCERARLRLECLLIGPPTTRIEGRLRFFQLVRRRVERYEAGQFHPTFSLEVDDDVVIPWDEGALNEIELGATMSELLDGPARIPVRLAGGIDEEVFEHAGARQGRVLRQRWPVTGELEVRVEPVAATRPLHRLVVTVENTTAWVATGISRHDVLPASMLATHLCLATTGEFVSAMDPPAWAAEAAAACRCEGTYPVLAGKPGEHDLLLAAPIVLYDHPRVAPESPGDFCDATEIDELLALRTMTLTPEEQREARATDRLAAEILQRVEAMPPADLQRLHGAIRSMTPAAPPGPGARVRVRAPTGRTDAQDQLLAGRIARVEKVMRDIDGETYLAVTFEEDPGADLHRWYGRFHYYRLSEVDPIPSSGKVST